MIKQLYFTDISKTRVSDADIESSEQLCGFKFPTAFVEFCRKYNGGFPDEQSEHYPVPEKYVDFYSEYREGGIIVAVLFGLTTDPEPCNALRAQKQMGQTTIPFFPLARDYFGHNVVTKTEHPEGYVFFRDHTLFDTEGIPMLFQIADSVEEFYNRLEQNLERDDDA